MDIFEMDFDAEGATRTILWALCGGDQAAALKLLVDTEAACRAAGTWSDRGAAQFAEIKRRIEQG